MNSNFIPTDFMHMFVLSFWFTVFLSDMLFIFRLLDFCLKEILYIKIINRINSDLVENEKLR
ncbi:hypothetical protein HanRHA438_Chr06g0260321 [Helianthus annuus]|nr:hypothetical protein HanRHA438_Chr06g0260321 [Helianthus annuus]